MYRASRDDWVSSNFHSYCDNKGPTATVIKSENNIFGGYTEQSWDSKFLTLTWFSSVSCSLILFGRLRQGYSIINEGFEADQNFYLKNNQQIESILFCVCSVTENIKMS